MSSSKNSSHFVKYVIIGVIILGVLGMGLWKEYVSKKEVVGVPPMEAERAKELPGPEASPDRSELESTSFVSPLDAPEQRITKKPFGIRIDPKTSPVKPERFSGYHVGTDFEILPGEENTAVIVRAICSGKVLQVRNISGYGGLLVQECLHQSERLVVIYGHIDLASIQKKIGENLERGSILGELGEGMSRETDGERKHLHLGVYRGEGVSIRGYEEGEAQIRNWLNPCSLGICQE